MNMMYFIAPEETVLEIQRFKTLSSQLQEEICGTLGEFKLQHISGESEIIKNAFHFLSDEILKAFDSKNRSLPKVKLVANKVRQYTTWCMIPDEVRTLRAQGYCIVDENLEKVSWDDFWDIVTE